MPDFPGVGLGDVPVSFSTRGLECQSAHINLITNSVDASAVWTTANTAVYVPVTIGSPFLAQKMAFRVGVQSGNFDIGIYSEQGARLVSKGSTAVGAAGLQVVDITDTWLMPGTYFIAMNCDNTTAAFFGVAWGIPFRATGSLIQAVGAVTLPSPATFASWGSTSRMQPAILVAGVPTV